MDNVLYIDSFNRQQHSYQCKELYFLLVRYQKNIFTVEANQFADQTFDEFKSAYLIQDPQVSYC